MIRRPLWLATGVALGVGGTLWAEQRLRRVVRGLGPDHMARQAAGSVRDLGGRVRHAVEAGRSASEERESELRNRLVPDRQNGNGRERPTTGRSARRQ